MASERHVRPGRFFRGPALADLTPNEQEILASIDPGVVVDLRSHEEVAARPAALPPMMSGRRVHLPLPALVDERMNRRFGRPGIGHADVVAAIADSYRSLVRRHADVYRQFLRILADAGDGPVFFHCTAGKDRTGLAAALILAALDAPPDVVEKDYLATGDLWWPDPELEAVLPPAARPAVFGVAPGYLEAALEELTSVHGGPVAFARSAMGSSGYLDWKKRHSAG